MVEFNRTQSEDTFTDQPPPFAFLFDDFLTTNNQSPASEKTKFNHSLSSPGATVEEEEEQLLGKNSDTTNFLNATCLGAFDGNWTTDLVGTRDSALAFLPEIILGFFISALLLELLCHYFKAESR